MLVIKRIWNRYFDNWLFFLLKMCILATVLINMRFTDLIKSSKDLSISLNWSWCAVDVNSQISFGKQAVLIVVIIFARREITVEQF